MVDKILPWVLGLPNSLSPRLWEWVAKFFQEILDFRCNSHEAAATLPLGHI